MSTRVKIDEGQVVYPYAVRDAVRTQSTTMLNSKECLNCETIFITAETGNYHDLLSVYGVNSSDQAIRLNFHENYGGTSQFKLQMAASSSAYISWIVPWKSGLSQAWWADFDVYGGVTDADDVTNTTVTISAQYIKL
jgi:hypothetical protein